MLTVSLRKQLSVKARGGIVGRGFGRPQSKHHALFSIPADGPPLSGREKRWAGHKRPAGQRKGGPWCRTRTAGGLHDGRAAELNRRLRLKMPRPRPKVSNGR